VEAVELYPAASRLVDHANEYHLWALDSPEWRWPIGWKLSADDVAKWGSALPDCREDD
jgi:hypothetical protein